MSIWRFDDLANISAQLSYVVWVHLSFCDATEMGKTLNSLQVLECIYFFIIFLLTFVMPTVGSELCSKFCRQNLSNKETGHVSRKEIESCLLLKRLP